MKEEKAFRIRCAHIENHLTNDAIIKVPDREIHVIALWDTGATTSCISYDVVKELNLIPTGKININTVSGESEQNTFLVDVILPDNVEIPDLPVADSEIGRQNIGILIGMDIIGMGDFAVSNFEGKTNFTFRIPSKRDVNYVKEARLGEKINQSHKNKKR